MDHVDPVDVDAVDRRGELKDRGSLFVPPLDVVKVTIAEHLCGCLEVHRSLFSAFLRGEHRGGEEHCVIGEQGLQVDGAAALDDRDPASNYGWRHTTILADSAQRATSATRPDAGAVASPSWRTSKPRTASPSGCRSRGWAMAHWRTFPRSAAERRTSCCGSPGRTGRTCCAAGRSIYAHAATS